MLVRAGRAFHSLEQRSFERGGSGWGFGAFGFLGLSQMSYLTTHLREFNSNLQPVA